MADRKTAILDAAIAVIANRGVRGLRVEEVAKEAGVAVSLLYYHFGTRDGLVRATLDHANERAAAAPTGEDAGSGFAAVERTLLGELDAAPHVRESSVVWGEVLASADFEPGLRDQLRAWACREVASRVDLIGADVVEVIPDRIGSRAITALVAERIVREILTGVAVQRVARDTEIANGRPSIVAPSALAPS